MGRNIHKVLPVAAMMLIGVGAATSAVGYRVNTSASIPIGIYRVTNTPVQVGRFVQVCPTDTPIFKEAMRRSYIGPGPCPGGYGYLFKKVLAAKNDYVEMTTTGMRVNGRPIPFSRPLQHDGAGRLLQSWVGQRMLSETDVIIMTDSNPQSFDSRYFGVIPQSNIISVVRPILTWGHK